MSKKKRTKRTIVPIENPATNTSLKPKLKRSIEWFLGESESKFHK